MSDTGPPPVIPTEFQQYNSYVTDPQWQRKFSTIWPSFLGLFVLISLPSFIRSLRNGRAYTNLKGISDSSDARDGGYTSLTPSLDFRKRDQRKTPSNGLVELAESFLGRVGSIFYWMIPGIGLNAGQTLIIVGYSVTVVLCIVINAPLVSNSNRAGFMAISQIPVVFLFATKNSVVSFLLGPGNGYERLNFVHRWSGRTLFLAALLHGSLWIRNHLVYNLPILGQQKETSGVASFGLLCAIVLSSLKPVRMYFYEFFYITHVLAFVAFFITICYHTIYASPWIFPALAFYGLDLFIRMFRFRIQDALLVPIGNQMTLVHVPYSTAGWLAGQHVRLRIFFSGRIFESHPLSIFSATPDISCISSMPAGLSFGVRTCGDWSKALNAHALRYSEEMKQALRSKENELYNANEIPTFTQIKEQLMEVPIQVMLDGPYGGCSVDLGRYETVVLFAGGSGITFTLGILDDIVGRCIRLGRRNGEITKRIELSWCVRSFGNIDWFAPALMDIAQVSASSSASANPIDLHISIYVTCLCNPEAVPSIPNCDVTIQRPSVYRALLDLTTPPSHRRSSSSAESADSDLGRVDTSGTTNEETPEKKLTKLGNEKGVVGSVGDAKMEIVQGELDMKLGYNLPWVEPGGGLAVCASGPESMIVEASNAVAKLHATGRAASLGSVGLHTEIFKL